LDDEIGPFEGHARIVQQATEDVRRISERKRADHAKRLSGQAQG
jgi:hypothetical protein